MFTITTTTAAPRCLGEAPTLGTARTLAEAQSRSILGDVYVRDRHGDPVFRYRDGRIIGSMNSRRVPVQVVRSY